MVNLEIATFSRDPSESTAKSKAALIISADDGNILGHNASIMLELNMLRVKSKV